MAEYRYPEDGKLHTRYSELKRATPGQVEKLLQEKAGNRSSFKSKDMEFGTTRHQMWEEESLKTGRIPACFGVDLPAEIIEREFAIEIFRDMVIHFQSDSITPSLQTITDYKTVILTEKEEHFYNGLTTAIQKQQFLNRKMQKLYATSIQLKIYAFCLQVHKLNITKGQYLGEFWSKDRERVLGYSTYKHDIALKDKVEAKSWLKSRLEVLAIAKKVLDIH